MLREMRVGWARGRGRIELQVHNAATVWSSLKINKHHKQ